MNNVKTGNLIKQLRKEKGLTQKDLAEQLGITDKAISKWERGLSSPDISLLEELSQILNITVLEIIKGKRNPKNKEITNKDIIDTMKYSREKAIEDVKKIYKAFTYFIIGIIIIFIIITNIKSITLEHKTIDMSKIDYNHQTSKTSPKELINKVNSNVDIILNNQGIYTDEEYNVITKNIKLLQKDLTEQNNEFYLDKKTYSFREIMDFYQKHQSDTYIYAQEIYEIILKHNSALTENLIEYIFISDEHNTNFSNIYNYLSQPYTYRDNLPYKKYQPNPYYIITLLYQNYNNLLNDILEVGELK